MRRSSGVCAGPPALVGPWTLLERPTRATGPCSRGVIEHLHQLTGIPVVLNTSFNDREPIVETPAHALATFQACDLDAMCIGDYLVERH
ncbi:hypothetical protein J4709_28210 [Actinomadura sp. LCR2-06]|uniref:Carbamoyltransferase C-terminal domain-containing protein n=1 Tax=Actinomadura violacea TaxID=2819934 RepID=A0ABS3RXI9_9ACTN|nr:hypothetical protein [Actinomadura violacea]